MRRWPRSRRCLVAWRKAPSLSMSSQAWAFGQSVRPCRTKGKPSSLRSATRASSISGLDRMSASTRVPAAMRRQHDVDLVLGEPFAKAGEELDIMGIEEEVAVGLQHRADRAGTPGGEAAG